MKKSGVNYCCLFLFLFLLSSCQKKGPLYIIGISQCSDDSWRAKMNQEMVHEASLHNEVELVFRTVEDDTEQQIKDIESFIKQKVDLIIVAPNKAAPITPVVEKAFLSGIPVVLVDRKILSDKYTSFIGADNYQIGKEVGNYVASLLKGKGNIVELKGLDGSTPALERHQGFNSIICRYPEIKLIFDTDAAWSGDSAKVRMETALTSHPNINLVFAHNDRMAMGAYTAAEEQNRTNGVYFLGIDALPGKNGGIEQVLNNKLKATFIYPTGGDKIIQLALDILQNKEYKKNNVLYTAVVDQNNARILKLQSDEILEQQTKVEYLNKKIDNFMSLYTTQRYLLYIASAFVILLIGFFIILFLAYRSKNRLNKELEKKTLAINAQKEKLEEQRDQLIALSKQLEDATHAKLVFFTNISHEFRTPLTLISVPVNSILVDPKISLEQKRLLSLAQKNIAILLKLVDQIIDFRKYENGKLTLNLSRNDLKQQLMEWNESFAEVAAKRQLQFKFEILSSSDFLLNFDLEKMERIYFNLLSNALKFTLDKGKIHITLDRIIKNDKDWVEISISNSGKGISENDIRNIFERFYQIDSRMAGSGIGLALVKSLVELHKGEIGIKCNPDGMTIFTFIIPAHLERNPDSYGSKEELSEKPEQLQEEARLSIPDPFSDENKYAKDKNLILIVDDNPGIRVYIRSILENQYAIIEAQDGEDGFKKAVKYVPDMIISDVMMPKKDGIELCNQLKKELSTSHIPIILLTACSLDEQRVAGFESGADAYISKPFNPDLLEVRIRKLIDNRRRLKELYEKSLSFENSNIALNKLDNSFLERFRKKIEENIADSSLSVEDLGKSLGLSRTQLYRKIKSLTNYSPNELLRIIRLKKSFALLTSSEHTVAEIAYDTGFTSASYFTKCFKEYYGENPTDYLKRIKN